MAAVTIFSDAIDVLEKIGNIVISAGEIPGQTRRKYAEAVEETYGLIQTAVNLVYLRLGDLLNTKPNKEFLERASALDNIQEWWELERKIGLCSNLRLVHSEMDRLALSALFRWSKTDLKKVRSLVDEILEREGQLARFLSRHLQRLAQEARKNPKAQDLKALRAEVKRKRDAIDAERKRLVMAEVAFLNALTARGGVTR